MKVYEHRQFSQWMLFLAPLDVIWANRVTVAGGPREWMLFAFGILVTTLPALIYCAMITRVDDTRVSWGFTFGSPCGHLALDQISSCEIVKIRWWESGGGKPPWTKRFGKLWTVGASRGVLFYGSNGERFTIGTNDAEGFLAAIQQRLKNAAL